MPISTPARRGARASVIVRLALLALIVASVIPGRADATEEGGTSGSAGATITDGSSPCGSCGAGQCVTVHQYCDENDDGVRQGSEDVAPGSIAVTEVDGIGQFETGDFFCTTEATLTHRVRRGDIVGPDRVTATSATLDSRLAAVRMSLRIDGSEVDPTDDARVEIQDLGITQNGDTFWVPLDTCLTYRRIRGSTDPWSICPDKTFSGEGTCGDWVVNFDDMV